MCNIRYTVSTSRNMTFQAFSLLILQGSGVILKIHGGGRKPDNEVNQRCVHAYVILEWLGIKIQECLGTDDIPEYLLQ